MPASNLAARLEAALHPASLALLKTVAAEADALRLPLYLVGGFVRDLLLDRPSLDFDLVVEGDAVALAKALAARHGGRVTTHGRFGTAKWVVDQKWRIENRTLSTPLRSSIHDALDLITARSETYAHPAALPAVTPGSIRDDLQRRDFTLNTLALRLDGAHYGELLDPWGGLDDLNTGLIRVLHNRSFVDDPTRILRAVRFEQRFGFAIEPGTLALVPAALPVLDRLSGDRLRREFDHILDEPNAAAMLARLDQLGVLKAIHPLIPPRSKIQPQGLPDKSWGLGADFKGMPFPRALAYTLWLIDLPADSARQVARRLKFTAALEAALLDACTLRAELPLPGNASPFGSAQSKPSELTFRLDRLEPLAVYAVHIATGDERLQTWGRVWRRVQPVTTGHDLLARGLPPGPAYKAILTALRRARLDGEVNSDEEERARLESLIKGGVS